MEEEKKPFACKVKEKAEQVINNLINKDELSYEEIKVWYQLADIHKDMIEEEKNEKEMENMNYRDYNGYGEYSGSYGRRGVPGTGRGRYRGYRGEDALNEMSYHYGNYMNSGNYGAKEDSSQKMIDCFKEFGFSIAEELEPKDKMMFKQAMQEVMQELK